MASAGEILVKVGAETSGFSRSIGQVVGSLGDIPAAAALAGAAIVAAMSAAVKYAGDAVTAFADFDKGMREVFTLMPGISREAMGDMNQQVLDFARNFGVLPEDVIPALYNALSAGVPPGNVFDFLETAQRTAVGGATDLLTAVDGLTSVVNAYGAEVIDAAEAADVFFTGMRLGKTTVGELSDVVGQVAPIAAATGVTFQEVTASLAAMTASGLDTASAATSLRGILTSLLSPTKEAQREMMRVNQALIANGQVTGPVVERFQALQDRLAQLGVEYANVQAAGGENKDQLAAIKSEAQELEKAIEEYAAALNLAALEQVGLNGWLSQAQVLTGGNADEMGKLFGNVRALNGALILTSDSGGAAFLNALREMENASGAANDAYEVMAEGITMSFNRLRAGFKVMQLEVGMVLAPMFQEATDFIVTSVMPLLTRVVLDSFTAIARFTNELKGEWQKFQTDTDGIYAQVRDILVAFGEVAMQVFTIAQKAWNEVLEPAWTAMAPTVAVIFQALLTAVQAALEAIKIALDALAAFLEGDFTNAWALMQTAIQNYLLVLRDYIVTVWTAIKDFLLEVWTALVGQANQSFGGIATAIMNALSGIAGFVQGVFDAVVNTIKNAVAAIQSTIAAIQNTVANVRGAVDSVGNAVNDVAGRARDVVSGFTDAVGGIFGRTTPPPITSPQGGGGGFPGMQAFATGGIVTGPTIGLVGEAGPEAIIPLDRLGSMLGTQTIIVELDGRVLTQAVAPRMIDNIRLKTGLATF